MGDITARVVVGDSEDAISARSRVDAIPARRWCGRSFFHIALFEDHCGCQCPKRRVGTLIVSMLANLVIDANRFETTPQPASTVADPKAQ